MEGNIFKHNNYLRASFDSLHLIFTLFFFSRPGGDRIYGVFDHQLPAALKKLPFDKHLSMQNVRKVISEADGYQPHLIAPEQGYRRLIDSSLSYFKGPAEATVDQVWLLCRCMTSFISFSLLVKY